MCIGFYSIFYGIAVDAVCNCETILCRHFHCMVTLVRPISCCTAGLHLTSRFNRWCCTAQWDGRVSATFYSTWLPRQSLCGTWCTHIPVLEPSSCLRIYLFLLGFKLLNSAYIVASLLRRAPFSSPQVPNFRANTRELYRREDRFR